MSFKQSGWKKLVTILLVLSLLLGLGGALLPGMASAAEGAITIKKDGAVLETFELEQLEEDCALGEFTYSTINTWPTKDWYEGTGIMLDSLIEYAEYCAGLEMGDVQQIRFKAKDGLALTFTVKEMLEDTRYYFPGLKENHEYFGEIPGNPDGALEVPIILSLTSREAPHLHFGQRWITEQTNQAFVKYVNEIDFLTTAPGKWDNPVAEPAAGTVSAGTEVRLSGNFMDADKIYYTTDGSDPTYESPMYNWIASRWWNNRKDKLDEINKPITITEDTIIKAVSIGNGREDSDIVTFEYTIGDVAVTGVSIAEGDQSLDVSDTVQLTAVVEPGNAANKEVVWSSNNETVATVSANGLVTAVSPGTATITVETIDGNKTYSVNVVVLAAPDFEVEDGALVRYRGAGGDVIIPDEVAGEAITKIGDKVFKDLGGLTSVVIPEGVTNIGTDAFRNCSRLSTVVFPESLSYIGNTSFMGCSNLQAIAIPENVTYMGNNVFNGCKGLAEVILPGNLGTINTGTFDGCSGLNTVTIMEGITSIGSRAFAVCNNLSSVNLPESLTKIDSNAFLGCKNLTEIILPDSITTLGIGAFKESGLVTITIPGKVAAVPVNAFEGCASLARAVLSEGVTRINSWAFDNCRSLNKLSVPRSVNHIAAFSGCPNLTIYGYAGSYAEARAAELNVPFEVLTSACTVIFTVAPGDAAVEVKDSAGEAMIPEADGTYLLEAGDYSYTVTKDGYKEAAGTFTVTDQDETITVILEKIEIEGKEELQQTINETLILEESGYTPNSWRALSSPLRIAQTIFSLEQATPASVAQATARLATALEQLAEKADKDALAEAINTARVLNPVDYTARSWRQVSNALILAERVFQNENSTEDDVDQAAGRLNAALMALAEV